MLRMISAAVILATPALASAAAAVVPVVVDGTVAVTMLVNVSLYLQHKLRCLLVMIIFRLSQWLLLRGGDQLLHHLVRGTYETPLVAKVYCIDWVMPSRVVGFLPLPFVLRKCDVARCNI